MAPLSFLKYEGLGNDFIVVDVRAVPTDADALVAGLIRDAAEICDRRRGIGADGILVVLEQTESAQMIVINADGSRPEMCGNGLRCVVHHLLRTAAAQGRVTVRVATDNGVLTSEAALLGEGGENGEGYDRAWVQVAIGAARSESVVSPKAAGGRQFDRVLTGNPHAIHFVTDADEKLELLARSLGPDIEVDPIFARGTNVEFARVDATGIELWVWERGAGLTQACGTGACATAAAAVRRGLWPADHEIPVRLPGGELRITVPQDPAQTLLMAGPSRFVFTGVWGRNN